MQIDHLLILAAMLVIGFLVGIVYFQGLWLTINRFKTSKHLGGKLLISFAIRLTLAITIFYYFMQDDWQRLIAQLIGFLIARQVIIRKMRQPSPAPKPQMN